MNANCGNLQTLKEALKCCDSDPSTMQLRDENLKNVDGESNLEVRTRMYSFVKELLQNEKGKRIVAVSHGGAIRFLLMKWCQYDETQDSFWYLEREILKGQLETPSAVKLEEEELVSIEKV